MESGIFQEIRVEDRRGTLLVQVVKIISRMRHLIIDLNFPRA